MSNLPEQIRDKFIEKLLKHEEFNEELAENLRELMQQNAKLKSKDIETAFTSEKETIR